MLIKTTKMNSSEVMDDVQIDQWVKGWMCRVIGLWRGLWMQIAQRTLYICGIYTYAARLSDSKQ